MSDPDELQSPASDSDFDSTLFETLTELNPAPGVNVTKDLIDLLRLFGRDACRLLRNQHLVYWAVSEARDVTDRIHALVAGCRTLDEFYEYARMIIWMETILVEFTAITETESAAPRLGSSTNAGEDIDFIGRFTENRRAIRAQVEHFMAARFLQDRFAENTESIRNSGQRDDEALLRIVLTRLQAYEQLLTTASQSRFREDLDLLNSRQGALDPTQEANSLFLIQSAMLLEIVVSGRDRRMVYRREEVLFWDQFIREVKIGLQQSSEHELTKAYMAMVAYVKTNIALEIPKEFAELRSLVAHIPRPYHEQSVVLVSACAALVEEFRWNRSFARFDALYSAIHASTEALMSAVIVDPETDEFATALASIVSCLELFQVHWKRIGDLRLISEVDEVWYMERAHGCS
ncbi:hypothetical protein MKEN_00643800 [Mycena kentingensis (nom. inval.)]|nr:hypothetical protein MKEN_00643800 [Mycena kentingensis (nom. inval.)]